MVISGEPSKGKLTDGPLTSISWKKDEGPVNCFIVSYERTSEKSDKISMWSMSSENKFKTINQLPAINSLHSSTIEDVNWASGNARSYHLVSTCGKDGGFIWRLGLVEKEDNAQVAILGYFKLNVGEIRTINWNHLGTILTAKAADGKLRLMRRKYDHSWESIEEFE